MMVWMILITYLLVPTTKVLNGEGRKWMFRIIKGSIFSHFRNYESRYTFFTE